MKTAIRTAWTALLVGSLVGLPVSGFAQGPSGQPSGGSGQPSGGIARLLAGTAVSNRDLRSEAGRGLTMSGTVENNWNTGGGGGTITNTQSINGNTGITTVFQDTGNNSLFQSQTVINVAIH